MLKYWVYALMTTVTTQMLFIADYVFEANCGNSCNSRSVFSLKSFCNNEIHNFPKDVEANSKSMIYSFISATETLESKVMAAQIPSPIYEQEKLRGNGSVDSSEYSKAYIDELIRKYTN